MRGKYIVWLSMIAVLVSAMMVGAGLAQEESRIYVNPAYIDNRDMSMTEFIVSIEVENVVDLYTYAFELHFAKYVSTIGVDLVAEGDFFSHLPSPIPYSPKEFGYQIRDVQGVINVGFTLRGDYPGVSGSGTLALFRFTVLEVGVSPLTLENVRLLDSEGKSIREGIEHGYYEGPIVNLVRAKLGKRPMSVGEIQTFDVRIKNEGLVPLDARCKIESIRLEDGEMHTFYAGLAYSTAPPPPPVYKYVDGFIPWIEEWTTVGTEPWLDAPDDGNYIAAPGPIDGAIHGLFTFEDIVLPAGYGVGRVTLEGYTDGPFTYDVDYDMFSAANFGWIGSLYATGEPAWVGVRWTSASLDEVDPSVKDIVDGVPAFNDLMVLAMLYDPYGVAVPEDIIDCLRVKVEFGALPIPELEVPAGAEMDFGTSEWTLRPENVGTYVTTFTVQTTYNGFSWNPAPKVQTKTWWVTP